MPNKEILTPASMKCAEGHSPDARAREVVHGDPGDLPNGGLELRRQRCRTVVKNPNRLVSSGPGTPPLPIDVGKSGPIRGVWWNGGGTGTYSSAVWRFGSTGEMRSTRKGTG
jgi:hypothetical protein